MQTVGLILALVKSQGVVTRFWRSVLSGVGGAHAQCFVMSTVLRSDPNIAHHSGLTAICYRLAHHNQAVTFCTVESTVFVDYSWPVSSTLTLSEEQKWHSQHDC